MYEVQIHVLARTVREYLLIRWNESHTVYHRQVNDIWLVMFNSKKNYLTARWRPWSLPAVDGSADRLVLLLLLSKEDPRCLLPGGLVAATRGRHRGGGRGQLQPEGLCPLGAAQGTGSTPAPTAASFLCSGQNAWSFNGLLRSNPRQFECMYNCTRTTLS